MKIQFLSSSEAGMQWMRRYYKLHLQLNSQKAFAAFRIAQRNLSEGLVRGKPYDGLKDIFEYSVSSTPFSIIYTQRNNTIYIVDIRDPRGLRTASAINDVETNLRKQFDL